MYYWVFVRKRVTNHSLAASVTAPVLSHNKWIELMPNCANGRGNVRNYADVTCICFACAAFSVLFLVYFQQMGKNHDFTSAAARNRQRQPARRWKISALISSQIRCIGTRTRRGSTAGAGLSLPGFGSPQSSLGRTGHHHSVSKRANQELIRLEWSLNSWVKWRRGRFKTTLLLQPP